MAHVLKIRTSRFGKAAVIVDGTVVAPDANTKTETALAKALRDCEAARLCGRKPDSRNLALVNAHYENERAKNAKSVSPKGSRVFKIPRADLDSLKTNARHIPGWDHLEQEDLIELATVCGEAIGFSHRHTAFVRAC